MNEPFVTCGPHPKPMAGVLPWFGTHYGCRVARIDEDGLWFAVVGPDGHVPERRARAAILHFLRTDCGYHLYSGRDGWQRDYAEDVYGATVRHRLVYDTGREGDPWIWCTEDQPGAQPVTLVKL